MTEESIYFDIACPKCKRLIKVWTNDNKWAHIQCPICGYEDVMTGDKLKCNCSRRYDDSDELE